MKKCWRYNPENRPTLGEIIGQIHEDLDKVPVDVVCDFTHIALCLVMVSPWLCSSHDLDESIGTEQPVARGYFKEKLLMI